MGLRKFARRNLKPSLFWSLINFDLNKIEIVEFRKLRIVDEVDLKYQPWSRIYEYPLVLKSIDRLLDSKEIEVHNSSWGFDKSPHIDTHLVFKNDLENRYKTVINTDILESRIENTSVLDITVEPPENYKNRFDAVLNVSTVEEVYADHILIIKNLLDQVREGGILIITFDLPGMQIRKLERKLGRKIKRFDDELNGSNSAKPNLALSYLSCGLLILRKNRI